MSSETHQPKRDDDVAQWIKAERDKTVGCVDAYEALNWLLDDYRIHADMGLPLSEDVPFHDL